MFRTIRKGCPGVLVEFQGLAMDEVNGGETISVEIDRLLERHPRVFEMPNGLPPPRNVDHAIILKEGTDPINVRPYRYPHIQKNEIERLVFEMLAAGIIQPSNSPFSSPVLLVKNKDDS